MSEERQSILGTERIGKLLWKMSYPTAIGGAVLTLYNIVDTIFIGRVVGPLGIAGLTIVFPIQMLAMGIGMMIGIGGASLISRALGAGDLGKAERTLGNSISYTVIIGALVTIAGLVIPDFWLKLAGASETILPYAKDYLIIILLGTIFRIGGMGIAQLVRAEGNARVAMMSMVISFALNIALDAIFVLALGMGIKGAAIATVISEIVCCLYILHYYLFRNSTLKIHIRNLMPERQVSVELIAIGFGSFIRTAGMSIVSVIVNRTLVSYGGDLAVAAYGMVFRAMTFSFLPLMSISEGFQPILGFNYGAQQYDRALKAIWVSVITSTFFSILVFLIIFFLPEPIMSIFTKDSELIAVGSHAARIIFAAAALMGFQMVASTAFQALGKIIPTFLTSISRHILFLLPLIYILPTVWQLDGVWWSFPLADALSFLLTLAFFIPQIRQLQNLDSLQKKGELPVKPYEQLAGGPQTGDFQDRIEFSESTDASH